MASTLPTCSRCKRTGHVAVECSQPFFRTCAYCKEMGHAVKSCPKLFAKKLAALDDSSSTVSTNSRSTAVTAATSVPSTASKKPATPSKDGKANGRKPSRQLQKAPVPDPRIQFLSEAEEMEARKLEKKLREISVLEAKRDAGERLDVLQVKKLETRKELENHSVMRKMRLGYARLASDK